MGGLWLLLALTASAWRWTVPTAAGSPAPGIGLDQAGPCQISATTYSADFYSLDTVICGRAVAEGAVINAYDPQGVCCGTTLAREGEWGIMAVYGDDPDTPADEGAQTDEPIAFTVDGWLAEVTSGDPRWRDMARREVALRIESAPPCAPAPGDTPTAIPTATPTSTGTPSTTPSATAKFWARVLVPLALR